MTCRDFGVSLPEMILGSLHTPKMPMLQRGNFYTPQRCSGCSEERTLVLTGKNERRPPLVVQHVVLVQEVLDSYADSYAAQSTKTMTQCMCYPKSQDLSHSISQQVETKTNKTAPTKLGMSLHNCNNRNIFYSNVKWLLLFTN